MAVVERLGIHAAVGPADPDRGASIDRSARSCCRPTTHDISARGRSGTSEALLDARAGGSPREVGSLTAGTIGAFDVGGRGAAPVVAGTWESAVNPPELVRIDASSGARKPLSTFNTDACGAGRLAAAPGVLVHEHARHAHPQFHRASAGVRRLAQISALRADAWRTALHVDRPVRDPLELSPARPARLRRAADQLHRVDRIRREVRAGHPRRSARGPALEINEAADYAIKSYPFIDGSRQAAGGASYGGHLANWLAVSTTRYKALVSHAGLFDQAQQWGTSDIDLEPRAQRRRSAMGRCGALDKQNPLSRAGNLKTPMLVTVGERDYRVPMNNAIQLWSALQRMKVPSPADRLPRREPLGAPRRKQPILLLTNSRLARPLAERRVDVYSIGRVNASVASRLRLDRFTFDRRSNRLPLPRPLDRGQTDRQRIDVAVLEPHGNRLQGQPDDFHRDVRIADRADRPSVIITDALPLASIVPHPTMTTGCGVASSWCDPCAETTGPRVMSTHSQTRHPAITVRTSLDIGRLTWEHLAKQTISSFCIEDKYLSRGDSYR